MTEFNKRAAGALVVDGDQRAREASSRLEMAAEDAKRDAELAWQNAAASVQKAEWEAEAARKAEEAAERANQEADAARDKAKLDFQAAALAEEAIEEIVEAARKKAHGEAEVAAELADASERARREALVAQKHAKHEVEKARQKAEKARREAVDAQAKAERAAFAAAKAREAVDAKILAALEQAEQEATKAREAAEAFEIARQKEDRRVRLETETRHTREEAGSEQEASARRTYEGTVRLGFIRPVSASQIKKCGEFLASLPDVQVLSHGGSGKEEPHTIVSLKKPLALGEILSRSPLIRKVVSTDKKVEIYF